MRRWQAALVAIVAAVAVSAVSLGTPRSVDAGVTPVNLYLDCDTSTAGIQASCNPGGSPATVTIDAVLENVSGAPFDVAAYNISFVGDNQPLFTPAAPSCVGAGLDCNPDHMVAGASWSCGPPTPNPDQDPSAGTSSSRISCFNADTADTPVIANGATMVLARLTLNVSGTGVGDFTIEDFAVTDDLGAEQGACNPPPSGTASTCVGATIQIGGSSATNTPTALPTSTNTPVATATTCVGAACPTTTSQAFVTVTLTPSATVPPSATPPSAGTPPPGGTAPGGAAPGGGSGAGAGGPIRLPDTGTGAGDGNVAGLWALAAAGMALALGGSLALTATSARVRREGK